MLQPDISETTQHTAHRSISEGSFSYLTRSRKHMSEIRKSPEGVAIHPRLNTPCKRHSSAGVYYCRIRFTAADAAPLIAEIDEARGMALRLAKRSARTDRIAARIKLAEPP